MGFGGHESVPPGQNVVAEPLHAPHPRQCGFRGIPYGITQERVGHFSGWVRQVIEPKECKGSAFPKWLKAVPDLVPGWNENDSRAIGMGPSKLGHLSQV